MFIFFYNEIIQIVNKLLKIHKIINLKYIHGVKMKEKSLYYKL